MIQSDYPELVLKQYRGGVDVTVEDIFTEIINAGAAMSANFIRSHKTRRYPSKMLANIVFNRTGVLGGLIYSKMHLNCCVEVKRSRNHHFKWLADYKDNGEGTKYQTLCTMLEIAPAGSIYRDDRFVGMRNINEYVKTDGGVWLYNGCISLIEPREEGSRTRVPIGLKQVVMERLELLPSPEFEIMFLLAMENMVKVYDTLFDVNPITPHWHSIRKDLNPVPRKR